VKKSCGNCEYGANYSKEVIIKICSKCPKETFSKWERKPNIFQKLIKLIGGGR
jgi:hypothetical protein